MKPYILAGIIALLAAIGGFTLYQYQWNGNSVEAFGEPFTLVDQNGAPISEQAFRGQPSVVFFGFTHCPEVCPTTLFEMDGWLTKLGDEGREIKAFFVSVDPERDTPEVLKDYIRSFSERYIGITGDPEKVAAMAKSFRIFSRKVDTGNGDYTIDHTASILMLKRDGSFFGTITYEESPDTALTKLKRLAREG